MEIWNKLKTPPETALKKIQAGRLKGMSDINPQWRYQALTEQFGPCGVGWKFEITKQWIESGSEGQICAFTNVFFYFKSNDKWSDPIPGTGGSMLVAKETKGLHVSDEAFKMSLTDAIGTAAKMIGLAADVYSGNMDGSKYSQQKSNVNNIPACPKCGQPGREEKDKPGSYYCWLKKGGCGHKWANQETTKLSLIGWEKKLEEESGDALTLAGNYKKYLPRIHSDLSTDEQGELVSFCADLKAGFEGE